jgi:NAD(P)-dependent dehydrogenase (short-subunit alcohol dehydrogenase family)
MVDMVPHSTGLDSSGTMILMSSRIFRSDLLSGQTALVTGGASGIGAAIARELGHLGANVVIASRNEERIATASAGLSTELGRTVHGIPCDIRDREAVGALVDATVDRTGRLDILVNNGGGQFFAPAAAISPRGWDAVVATNLTGTWNLTQAAANRWMLQHGGRIISITMNTVRGFPGMAHSCAARAGVEGMSRTLAVEWAAHNIQVNCIAPGIIASSGLKTYPDAAAVMEQAQRQIPAKRLGSCEEIAWCAAWLASPAGSYITGQSIIVDGGRTLWGETWPIPDPDSMPPIQIPVQPWETSE